MSTHLMLERIVEYDKFARFPATLFVTNPEKWLNPFMLIFGYRIRASDGMMSPRCACNLALVGPQ